MNWERNGLRNAAVQSRLGDRSLLTCCDERSQVLEIGVPRDIKVRSRRTCPFNEQPSFDKLEQAGEVIE
jgi:hypothetical protein